MIGTATLCVVDASLLASIVLRDDPTLIADAVAIKLSSHVSAAPALCWYELRNALRKAEVNKQIAPAAVDDALNRLDRFDIEFDEVRVESTMSLARDHKLKFHDACYLELSLRHALPLATLDKSLRRAAGEAQVMLYDG